MFAIAQGIINIFTLKDGFGRNVQYLQPSQIRSIVKLTTIVIMLHTIGTYFVRVSVCLFVLRLVPLAHRTFYKGTYLLMGFFTAVTLATFLAMCLECIPIQGHWDKSIKAKCIPLQDVGIIAKVQGGEQYLILEILAGLT